MILIDNTNVFIGGQQLSAERKGITAHSRHDHMPSDPSWRLDFDGLKSCLSQGREVTAAVMVGSAPPDVESAWQQAAEAAGFTVIIHETNGCGLEKAVDTELVARGTEIICSADEPMTLVLASGDRDYVPLVDVAHRNGWKVEMCAFSSSFSMRGEMVATVDKVRNLDDCLDEIGRCEFDWPRHPSHQRESQHAAA